MSMKLCHLPTYFDTHEAATVIAFLDQMRDVLTSTYGGQIQAAARREALAYLTDQFELDFDTDDDMDDPF